MRAFRISILWLASVGWLVPAFLSFENYFGYQRSEVQAFIWHGKEMPINSWPYLGVAQSCFHWAFAWFAAATCGWSLYGIAKLNRPAAKPEPVSPERPGSS